MKFYLQVKIQSLDSSSQLTHALKHKASFFLSRQRDPALFVYTQKFLA